MEHRPQRLRALRASLVERGFDALLVTSLPNIRYLTGFSGSNALLVVSGESAPVLLTDSRYAVQAGDEVGEHARVRIEPASLWAGLRETITMISGGSRLAFESAHLRYEDFERLADLAGRWYWRGTVGVVEALRDVPMYQLDPLLRRASSLQQTLAGRTAGVEYAP